MLLHPGEDDTQESHSIDEVYYIVRGNGFIKIENKDHKIKPGSIIFIPSKIEHKFHGNNQDLVIFYIFGGANPNKTFKINKKWQEYYKILEKDYGESFTKSFILL